jgi:NADP-dependent 3-hydroxy acid dehydrogenase YdfG
MHIVLWALDQFAANNAQLPPALKVLRAHFEKFLYLDELATVQLAGQSAKRSRLLVQVGDVPRLRLTLDFGEPEDGKVEWNVGSLAKIASEQTPLNPAFTELANMSGLLQFRMGVEDATRMFPKATAWLGADRIAMLAATTHLVGMICPGLHSIYSELSLRMQANVHSTRDLAFRVVEADERYRAVQIEVAGGGMTGVLETTARLPPVEQATMQSLSDILDRTEFAGDFVLVIGGSRGLGELTAKVIASGGGHVIITWQSGNEDAERVAAEIRTAGGSCDVIRYNAQDTVDEQLKELEVSPTHAYYFATPAIFKSASSVFSAQRLQDFLTIYVDGFWRLVEFLHERNKEIAVFYPSSIAVTERPSGMTEYTMAKAAGEILCDDLNKAMAPLHIIVSRLPRLLTDQTASVMSTETVPAVNTMLPIVREVQQRHRENG